MSIFNNYLTQKDVDEYVLRKFPVRSIDQQEVIDFYRIYLEKVSDLNHSSIDVRIDSRRKIQDCFLSFISEAQDGDGIYEACGDVDYINETPKQERVGSEALETAYRTAKEKGVYFKMIIADKFTKGGQSFLNAEKILGILGSDNVKYHTHPIHLIDFVKKNGDKAAVWWYSVSLPDCKREEGFPQDPEHTKYFGIRIESRKGDENSSAGVFTQNLENAFDDLFSEAALLRPRIEEIGKKCHNGFTAST